ncbi:MAG: potassium channel family protein [Bacteroidales bacterium]|nr:potassium channel family protein [Bacteroidales bacterium]
MTKQEFKQELNRVFDDDLHTKKWHNIIDWTIIGLIVISTIEIFLSTFDSISEEYGNILSIVDIVTQIFFTIEVTLRIWNADQLDPKYKGIWGRVRYCFTFYGMIDILATYPFYLSFFVKVPYLVLKSLRVMRLLRIFRYMQSFHLLTKAFKSKKEEMWVSLEFLVIVTLMLSFVLFFVEHEAQPEAYDNGWNSVVWAFAQYIGDPGGFADFPPITFCGRIIACIVGLLGIALFAVPAGLVGAGFTEAMEDEKHEKQLRENIEKLELAFERKLDRITTYQMVPKYISVIEIQARLGMSVDDIIEATNESEHFRLINLSTTCPAEDRAEDKLAVEHFMTNRPYGCCINRGSKVTIMCATSIADATMSWEAYYLAMMGGFNFISREIGTSRPFKSFYLHDGEDTVPMLKDYMDDLRKLAPTEDCWIVTVMAASGAQEPDWPTQVHFTYGAKKGDETYNDPNITIHDIDKFDAMRKTYEPKLQEMGLAMDCQRYYDNSKANLYVRQWNYQPNAIGFRVAWKEITWSTNTGKLLKLTADAFRENFDDKKDWQEPAILKKKDIGYRGYNEGNS